MRYARSMSKAALARRIVLSWVMVAAAFLIIGFCAGVMVGRRSRTKGGDEDMLDNTCGGCAAAVGIDGKQDVVGCEKDMTLHSAGEQKECFCREWKRTGETEGKETDHETM